MRDFTFFPFTDFEPKFKMSILYFSNLNLNLKSFKIEVTYLMVQRQRVRFKQLALRERNGRKTLRVSFRLAKVFFRKNGRGGDYGHPYLG